MEKIFDLEERLVRFAGETVFFTSTLGTSQAGAYYGNQIIRSTGSSALHYGEAQGTKSKRDHRHKLTGTLKELKESRTSFKIMRYTSLGDTTKLSWLINEVEELIAIVNTLIIKRSD